MASIAKDLLPSPSRVDVSDESVVMQSRGGGILRTHEPDPEVQPRSWVLHYDLVHGAVADALRRHFAEHAHENFDWLPPGAVDAVRVEHSAPPSITWQSNGSATCQAYLEEVPAFTP